MASLDNIGANVRTLTLHFFRQMGKYANFFIHLLLSRGLVYKKHLINGVTTWRYSAPSPLACVSWLNCHMINVSFIQIYCCTLVMCPNNFTGKDNNIVSYKKWTFMNILARYSLHNKRTWFFPPHTSLQVHSWFMSLVTVNI